MKNIYITLTFLLIILVGCKKEKTVDNTPSPFTIYISGLLPGNTISLPVYKGTTNTLLLNIENTSENKAYYTNDVQSGEKIMIRYKLNKPIDNLGNGYASLGYEFKGYRQGGNANISSFPNWNHFDTSIPVVKN